ncbi:hypothetical protein D9M72_531300 [compost metagenome]
MERGEIRHRVRGEQRIGSLTEPVAHFSVRQFGQDGLAQGCHLRWQLASHTGRKAPAVHGLPCGQVDDVRTVQPRIVRCERGGVPNLFEYAGDVFHDRVPVQVRRAAQQGVRADPVPAFGTLLDPVQLKQGQQEPVQARPRIAGLLVDLGCCQRLRCRREHLQNGDGSFGRFDQLHVPCRPGWHGWRGMCRIHHCVHLPHSANLDRSLQLKLRIIVHTETVA